MSLSGHPTNFEGSQRQARNKGLTEIVKIPDRGHALTIDNGWREVADMALAFVRKHGPKTAPA